MRHFRSAACGIAALALTLAASSSARPAHGQAQVPGPAGPRVASDSRDPVLPPIRIDAVVTDRHGRPVFDLRPSDFELQVDALVQPLDLVELRTPHLAADAPVPESDAAAAAARAGTRVFAFMLDEFHVAAGVETERVRDAMIRFIDTHLRPADLAVVLKPLDRVSAIRFTRDRQALRDAVSSFEGRKADFTPRSAFEEEFIGRAPATVAAARVQLVTVALNEVAMQLGELGAERAAIVFFSGGFVRSAPVRRGSRIIDLQGLLRAASRFHFPVYSFNPADPLPESAAPAPEPATLEWLAAQTGGAAAMDGRHLPKGLDRMAGELDSYYALTLPAGTADGGFHPIAVHVKRPGVSVRVRPGYWAPLSSELREWLRRTDTTPAAPRRALKRSALINVWLGMVPRPEGRREMVLTWDPAPRQPASRSGPAPARIELTARVEGTTLFEGTLTPSMQSGSAPKAARFGVPSGTVEIDMRVLAEDGALLDSELRDVSVPDLARADATIVLSPQVIRARTMNEFRAAVNDAEALPTSARSFSRSERLVIRLPAWAPAGEAIRTGVRVLNRRGQPIRALDQTGTAAGVPQFELPLYWLAPGEYYLEFSGHTEGLESRERLTIRITG